MVDWVDSQVSKANSGRTEKHVSRSAWLRSLIEAAMVADLGESGLADIQEWEFVDE